MTGVELKSEIKKLNITQQKAAEMLGITRATLSNWCKQATLPDSVLQNVKTFLGVDLSDNELNESDVQPDKERLWTLIESQTKIIESQQRTIENLSETIKSLTSK